MCSVSWKVAYLNDRYIKVVKNYHCIYSFTMKGKQRRARRVRSEKTWSTCFKRTTSVFFKIFMAKYFSMFLVLYLTCWTLPNVPVPTLMGKNWAIR